MSCLKKNKEEDQLFPNQLIKNTGKEKEHHKKHFMIPKNEIESKKEYTSRAKSKHERLNNKLLTYHQSEHHPIKKSEDDSEYEKDIIKKKKIHKRVELKKENIEIKTKDINGHTKNLHNNNHLTFAKSCEFDNKNKKENTIKEMNKLTDLEREKKILELISTDPSKNDINIDSLLKFFDGKIDANKLKELKELENIEDYSLAKDSELYSKCSENEDYSNDEGDFDLDNDSLEEKMNKLKRNSNINFFINEIKDYNDEKLKASKSGKEDKIKFKEKWESKIYEIEEINKNYKEEIKISETVRKRREDRIKKEKIREAKEKEREERNYEKQLERIKNKANAKKKKKYKNKSVDIENRNNEERLNWMNKKSYNYFAEY